jgi:hypothetical protein
MIAVFEPKPDNLGFAASPAKTNGKRKADEIDDKTNTEVGGWAYVGSHNFSGAAWVRFIGDPSHRSLIDNRVH